MPNESPVRPPLASGIGFACATTLSASIAIVLFILHVNNSEPAGLEAIAEPLLFALIGLVGGSLMFRSLAAGSRFAPAFLLYPSVARAFYQMGQRIPYGGTVMDLLTSLYFAILLPAIACGVVGAIAIGLLLRSPRFVWRGLAVFAIAGAIGGAVAPLLSWSLSQMATESALAATLAIYGEEVLRFFLAGFGLAWILRAERTA